MPGGEIQLVALGAHDLYLSDNPQISFFKAVYKRYTYFAQELINEPYLLKTCSYLEIEVEGENWSEFISRSGKIISHFHPKVD